MNHPLQQLAATRPFASGDVQRREQPCSLHVRPRCCSTQCHETFRCLSRCLLCGADRSIAVVLQRHCSWVGRHKQELEKTPLAPSELHNGWLQRSTGTVRLTCEQSPSRKAVCSSRFLVQSPSRSPGPMLSGSPIRSSIHHIHTRIGALVAALARGTPGLSPPRTSNALYRTQPQLQTWKLDDTQPLDNIMDCFKPTPTLL